MSYINDALKKAQTEKDSRYANYGDIIRASAPKSDFIRGKWPLVFMCFAVLLISACLSLYYWTDSIPSATKAQKVSVRRTVTPTPVSIPAPLPDPADLYRKALDAQKKDQMIAAERIYLEILRQRSSHSGALNNLGVIYMKQNRMVDAARMFNQAINSNEANADPYYNLACIHAQKNEKAESLKYLKKAVAINPLAKVWAKEDKDFQNIKALPEVKKILK
jgi:tetratricopeptide (TPR) repeat protein